MRAMLSIALALFAFAPCSAATVEEIAQKSMPSVAEIMIYDNTGTATGLASGFFISPQKIITNAHVVDGAYSAEILTDGASYDRVTILSADKDMDLAILRVDAENEIPLQINPDAELKPGQRVITIGHPLGLPKSLSDGLISSVQTLDGVQLVQITAPVSHGSSGSPVLDEEGRVIGVVYAGIEEGQNLNFAVGVETLTKFLALKETPKQLEIAGSYVLWRVVVKWIVAVIGVLIALPFGGGSWVIVIGIALIVLFWYVLSWLWKSVYRLLTLPFRQPPHAAGLVCRQASLIVGAVLLIGASWFLFSRATLPASPTQSTVAQIASAASTDTQDATVYITRTGSKYHRAGCRYLSKSKIPISLKEAKQHYAPCSVCKPPR